MSILNVIGFTAIGIVAMIVFSDDDKPAAPYSYRRDQPLASCDNDRVHLRRKERELAEAANDYERWNANESIRLVRNKLARDCGADYPIVEYDPNLKPPHPTEQR